MQTSTTAHLSVDSVLRAAATGCRTTNSAAVMATATQLSSAFSVGISVAPATTTLAVMSPSSTNSNLTPGTSGERRLHWSFPIVSMPLSRGLPEYAISVVPVSSPEDSLGTLLSGGQGLCSTRSSTQHNPHGIQNQNFMGDNDPDPHGSRSRRRSRPASRSQSRQSRSSCSSDESASSEEKDRHERGSKASKKWSEVRKGPRSVTYEVNKLQLEFNEHLAKRLQKLRKRSTERSVRRGIDDCLDDIEDRNREIIVADTYGFPVAKHMRMGDDLNLPRKEQDRLNSILLTQAVCGQGPSSAMTSPFRWQRGGTPRVGFQRNGGNNPYNNRFPDWTSSNFNGSYARRYNSRQGFGNGIRRQPKPTDQCNNCRGFGHWKSACPLLNPPKQHPISE